MESHLTFDLNNNSVVIKKDEKVVGGVRSCFEPFSSKNTYELEIYGFTEKSKVWSCNKFKDKKDSVLYFEPPKIISLEDTLQEEGLRIKVVVNGIEGYAMKVSLGKELRSPLFKKISTTEINILNSSGYVGKIWSTCNGTLPYPHNPKENLKILNALQFCGFETLSEPTQIKLPYEVEFSCSFLEPMKPDFEMHLKYTQERGECAAQKIIENFYKIGSIAEVSLDILPTSPKVTLLLEKLHLEERLFPLLKE